VTLPAFELHRAATVDEATELLGRFGDDAVAIAGGTELLLVLKLGFGEYAHLVDVSGIPELAGIRLVDGVLEIGAAVTHREIERSPLVREQLPALAEMERSVANIRVRTAGTLGGNLCFSDPHSDPATFLLAAGAEVVLRRGGGSPRVLPLGGFVRGPYETALAEGDLLTSVRVPATVAGTGIAHRKLAFRERPAATVAVWVRTAAGSPVEARIAVGSVGPVAVRATRAESLLVEGAADEEVAAAAAEASGAVEDADGSEVYKRQLVRVLVGRTLADAVSRSALRPGSRP
jgi:aerobic carbon-monoxide dehydrogenase medium subunit